MMQVESGKEASHRRAVGTLKTSIYKANEENELQLKFGFFFFFFVIVYEKRNVCHLILKMVHKGYLLFRVHFQWL